MGKQQESTTGGEGGSSASRPYDESVTPKDLKVRIAEQRLEIDWRDGRRSEYLLDELRRRCPCAACRTEREAQSGNPLRVLSCDPSGTRVTSAELIGNYAVKLTWSDGHDTGIFDFRFLRSLDTRVMSCDGPSDR